MKRLVDASLHYFALWVVVLLPFGWFAAYALSAFDQRYPLAIALYGAMAFATLDLAIGHIVLISGSKDGRAPAWLVAFTYSKISQTFTYYSVLALVISRADGVSPGYLEHLAYAMIGASAVAQIIAATVFTVVWLSKRGFGYRIPPWPWSVLREIKTSRVK